MRSVIPTQSSRAPIRLQTAGLIAAGLVATLLYVQARQRSAKRQLTSPEPAPKRLH